MTTNLRKGPTAEGWMPPYAGTPPPPPPSGKQMGSPPPDGYTPVREFEDGSAIYADAAGKLISRDAETGAYRPYSGPTYPNVGGGGPAPIYGEPADSVPPPPDAYRPPVAAAPAAGPTTPWGTPRSAQSQAIHGWMADGMDPRAHPMYRGPAAPAEAAPAEAPPALPGMAPPPERGMPAVGGPPPMLPPELRGQAPPPMPTGRPVPGIGRPPMAPLPRDPRRLPR